MNETIFREYDLRGIVGKEIIHSEIKNLTKAIITYFLQQKPTLSHIIVGMDGRTHSPLIKQNVIEAATELGINVTDIGLCPTPAFYFSLFNTSIHSGLIITASHNPQEYNGIKICLDKKSVWGTQIKKIKEIYYSKTFFKTANKTCGMIPPAAGKIFHHDIITQYIKWICRHFAHLKNKNINAVIDCGNATGGIIFPRLIQMMGWKNVKLLFETIDGTFPNHEADPTNPKNMIFVKKELQNDPSLNLGLGLDGDCDRMNPMTKDGILVPGDQLLALYSKKIIKNYPNAAIVFDIKSSDALIQALIEMGANPCIAPSGHSIIKEHLRKNNAKLAGELSCHFFFNDRYFGYDDGIYAALRLFELLEETKHTLNELLVQLPQRISSPEYRITCSDEEKNKIVDHVIDIFRHKKDVSLLTIDGIRATMPYGWGLIRASNTQPAICIRFESDSSDGLKKVQQEFMQALTKFLNPKILNEHFINEHFKE